MIMGITVRDDSSNDDNVDNSSCSDLMYEQPWLSCTQSLLAFSLFKLFLKKCMMMRCKIL